MIGGNQLTVSRRLMGMRRSRAVAWMSLVMLLVWPTAAVPASSAAPKTTARIVAERHVYGGLCQYGACETVMAVRADGRVSVREGVTAVRSSKLPARQVSRVVALVEATNIDPKSLPAASDCPPAYDGQATLYVLHRRAGTRVYDQCDVIVPTGGAFVELDRVWMLLLPSK